MKTNHGDNDLIMCYVLKTTGEPLGKKLAEEIKDTTVVISEMFPLGHLEEVKQIQSSIYGVQEKIFVYKKPSAKKTDTPKTKSKKVATKKTDANKTETKKTASKKAVTKKSTTKKSTSSKTNTKK